MKRFCSLFFIGLLLVGTARSLAAEGLFAHAERIGFDSAEFEYPVSPFKLKLAQKQGKTIEPRIEPAVRIEGYLARPDTDQPRPAVVVLHTCAGLSEHDEAWSRRLQSWGYVVLSVDSFTPRGFEYICDGRIQGVVNAPPCIRIPALSCVSLLPSGVMISTLTGRSYATPRRVECVYIPFDPNMSSASRTRDSVGMDFRSSRIEAS